MLNSAASRAGSRSIYPSVDDRRPDEEGGPVAREGFDWQDEVAVAFLIMMLEDSSILKVHCETHDDIIVVRKNSGSQNYAEYIQVKALNLGKFWSVPDLYKREKNKPGSSILETSFKHDEHDEVSRFRIVTTLPVVNDLKPLTYPLGDTARGLKSAAMLALSAELKRKFPGLQSHKGNDIDYWLDNCLWDIRHSDQSVRHGNFVQMSHLSAREGQPLLPEFAERILTDLRAKTKAAGRAKWVPDRAQKIIARDEMRQWWEEKVQEVITGASSISGSKLREKMEQAGLPDDMIRTALELRREYVATVREPRYLKLDSMRRLQLDARASISTLRAQFFAHVIATDAIDFHRLCVENMNQLGRSNATDSEDYSAFLQGFLYDTTDRCLLRFERPNS